MKNFKLILFLLTIFISNNYFSQNRIDSRESFTLKLAVDSLQFYQQQIPQSKYFVNENTLQIFPGEHIFIETEVKNNKIISMNPVKENLNPNKTIEIEFQQNVKGRKHDGMLLKVKNPFDKSLNYNALMYIVGNNKWLETSIIPIKPKLMNFEMWNDVIITLVLEDWRLE